MNVRWRIAFVVLALLFAAFAALDLGAGKAVFEPTLKVKPKLMSAVYKVYASSTFDAGAMWVAKTIIKNEGHGPIKDLKLSYRIPSIVEWSTAEVYELVYPGQTIVSAYYPVLPDTIAKTTTTRTVNLEFKYSWRKGNREVEEIVQRPLEILGVHDIMYSRLLQEENTGTWFDMFEASHLASAWVTPLDPVIVAFAGKANILGRGANTGREAQLAVMEQIWEMYRVNDILYMSTAGALTPDERFVCQSLKFPREVIQARQGTCIELALLYASTLEAAGIESMLVMLRGHCFPIGILQEGGGLVSVETTCLRQENQAQKSFAEACKAGQEEIEKLQQSGEFILVKPRAIWKKNCTPPELPELPADILERWNIKGLRDAYQVGNGAANAANAATAGQTQANPNARPTAGGIYRSRSGMFSLRLPSGWSQDTSPLGLGESEHLLSADADKNLVEVTCFSNLAAVGARDAASFVQACRSTAMQRGVTIIGEQQGSVGTAVTWALALAWREPDGTDMLSAVHCLTKGRRGYVVTFAYKKANMQAGGAIADEINQSVVLK
jgi:hypothetical protein